MNILILSQVSSVYSGNFIPSIKLLGQKFKNEGNNVFFAFPKKAYNRSWINMLSNFSCFFVDDNDLSILNNIIKTNCIDIVYFHFSPKIINKLMLVNRKIFYVRHVHTDMEDSKYFLGKIKLFIKKIIYPKSMISFFVSEKLMKEDKQSINKSFYLPNAIVKNRFDTFDYEEERKLIRDKFAIPNNAIVLLMFGWNIYVKGVDIALKAFEKAFILNENLYLMIVCGENADYSIIYNQIIDDKCKSHIICASPRESVQSYYFSSDIFLSASRSEGFSYSIQEAIILKKHVISSDLSAVSWAQNYKTCFFFKSQNFDDLSKIIIKVSENLNLNSSDLEFCSKQLLKDYNIDNWVNTIYKIIVENYINEK